MLTEHRSFDQRAASWDDNPQRVRLADDVAAAIRAAVPLDPRMRTLDFGCGTGLVTLRIQPQVGPITAADTAAGMLAVLAEKIAAAHLTTVSTLLLDEFPPAFPRVYDLIVSSMTLHHIADYAVLLRAFAAALQPGGYIALADLDPDDGQFHPSNDGVFHQGFDRAELQQALAAAGFTGVQARTAARVEKPVAAGALRRFSVFLITGRMPGR
jgi:predicted TPR repeat methyltransferase